jgi:hypothetical protein
MEAHEESAVMDSLLQRLNGRSPPHDPYSSSSGSIPITPATDEFAASTPLTEMDGSIVLVEAGELQKLKLELQEARNEVNRVNQEMHSQHVARSTMEHLSQSSEADYNYAGDVTEQTLTSLQNKFNASTRNNYGWGNEPARPAYPGSNSFGSSYQAQPQAQAHVQARPQPAQQPSYRRNGFLNEPTHFPLDQSFRSSGMANTFNTGMGNGMPNSMHTGFNNGMNNGFGNGMPMGTGMNLGNGLSNPPSRPSSAFDPTYSQYAMPPMYPVGHPAPIGTMPTRLSPDANEFNVSNGMGPSPWNSQVRT